MAADQTDERPRRFYRIAEAAALDGGFGVRLDARWLRTPAGARLVLPTQALAALIAEEWAAQETVIDSARMPLTRLAFTAIDRLSVARAETAAELARFAGSDLLCYFADAPAALTERQEQLWVPMLDWAKQALDLDFARALGVIHRPQPAETLARVEAIALAMDDFALAGAVFTAALLGSAILALAVRFGALEAEAAFELSRLDEAFQEEQWGVDAESAARVARMRAEASSLGRWFVALR